MCVCAATCKRAREIKKGRNKRYFIANLRFEIGLPISLPSEGNKWEKEVFLAYLQSCFLNAR